jgi:predicted kinase
VSARVYSRLRELAAAALRAGRSVIVDATFLKEGERKEIERIVARTGASFQGLWLQAPTDLLESRIRERRHDASDATVEVVEAQATQDTGAISWQRIDASQPLDITVARSLGVLEKAIPQ